MAHTVNAGPAKARSGVVLSLFNGSGKPNRPMSNLLDQKAFPLAKSEVTSLIALTKLSSKVWRDVQIWSAVAVEVLKPDFPFVNLKKVVKQHREMLPVVSKTCNETLGAPKFAKVTLTATGAQVSLPVMAFYPTTVRMMGAISTSVDQATEYFTNNSLEVVEKEVPTDSLRFPYAESKEANIFKALHGKFRIAQSGSIFRLFIDLNLNRTQVAFLCNTDFDKVRVIDLYGLVRTWAQGRTDAGVDLPKSTKPLKDIAATLPPGGEPRTNKDGILIDTDATLLYLPKAVDNIKRYDTSMSMELLNPDGSMSQAFEDKIKKLPGMQSVLLDWVNKKWSYVNGEGNLEVRDLSRSQPLNVTQIRMFTWAPISGNANLTGFLTRASALSTKVGGTPFSSLPMFISSGLKLLNLNEEYSGITPGEFALYHIHELANMWKQSKTNPAWAPLEGELLQFQHFCDTVAKLAKDIKENEDAYFAVYAVLTISSFLASCIVFTEYAGKHMEVHEADKQARSKYTEPMIDTAYKVPALPYIADDRGLMPHQANTSNMLRHSPDNAILAVQAGGGKTAIGVTDILKEMAQGVKGPFLVLCPSHLVSQYVQEFTYFTNGKVNVVAVNGYTLKNIGYAGLQKMIEAAPINTVVIADYNMAKGSSRTLNTGYGTSSTQVFRVVEFLRQFNFQYALLDESHKVKNPSATQTQAVSTLVIDIPKKRLASGTFLDNSPSDIAGQFALLDPTVFGSIDSFNTKYSADGTPGKIKQMKPGAELDILRTLNANCRYVSVKRKEWAAVLPPRIESMDHFVEMSPEQKRWYDAILFGDEASGEMGIINSLKEAALKNKDLAKLLGLGDYAKMDSKDREDMVNELDEEDKSSEMTGGLDELLRPYLARLEQYLVAPSRDKLGAVKLEGEDRVSPKVAELVKIYREHTGAKIPGKILVFTNQVASAEEMYNNLPSDIKARTIAYTSGQKAACGSEFETNPEKDMMIGVSQSMDTGLNLQFCFPGDTYVMTDYDKCLKLEDVYNTDSVTHVLSYDLESRKIERKPILQKTRNLVRAKDRYVSVKVRDLNSGVVTQQICTDNHYFITKGGVEVQAGELKPGSKLITYGGDFRKLKIEPQSGEPVDSFTRLNSQCPECGEWFDGTAMRKHKALVHGTDVAFYEEIRVVQSKIATDRFEDDDYRIRHSQIMKKVCNTPEHKAATSARGLASWENNEERRAQAAERSASRWADPVFRARVSSSIAEFYATDEGKAITKNANKKSQEFWASPEGKATRKAFSAAYWTPERRKAKAEEFAAMWADEDMRDYILGKMAETANDPELIAFKSAMTTWLHANVEGYTEKGIGAMLRAQGTLPNKPERNVIDLGIKGMEYTGDGKYFVTIELGGRRVVKNPDFVSLNHMKNGRTRKVIEVIGCREYTGRDAAYVADLKQAYAAIGIECLVIDAKYCYEKSERFEDVKPLLESFVNNHYLEVLDVREVTNPNQIGKYKYDITVEGNHNYFVVANLAGANSGTRPTTPMLVHNCSRLVRVETVMSPGALEQGNSRIGRPNIKATETRPATYYDWILCSGTIDITKVAYLLTKKVRIASVEEAANPAYAGLEVPELFNLSLDNIRENNTREALSPYLGPNGMYRNFLMCEKQDYDDFRNQNKHLLDDKGRLRMVKLEKGEDLKGSAIMRRIPYVPGLNLYGADQLGLVRLDQHLQLNEVASEDEDSESEADENPVSTGDEAEDAALTKRREFMAKVLGLNVHTEAGEGVVTGAKVRVGKVRVKLTTGEVIYASILSTFVITKPQTSGKDIRQALAKMSGSIPLDTPSDVPDTKKLVPTKKVIKTVKEEQTTDTNAYLSLDLMVSNDIIGLAFADPTSDKKTAKILSAMKFMPTPAHYYAKLANPQVMLKFFKALQANGYQMNKQQSELLANFYTKWLGMRANATSLFGMANATKQKNFYQITHKPNPDRKFVNAYVSTENGAVYLCLPSMGDKGNSSVLQKIHVPGVKFYTAPVQLIRYFNSPMEAASFLKKLEASGLMLTNEKELHKDFATLRREIPKATKKSMEQFFGEQGETK